MKFDTIEQVTECPHCRANRRMLSWVGTQLVCDRCKTVCYDAKKSKEAETNE